MKLLFVCKGNRGRSQIAEALFNSFYAPTHIATSAATHVGTHDGEKIPADIIATLAEEGIDASQNVSKPLTLERMTSADKVIVLCEKELYPPHLADTQKVVYFPITDPLHQGKEGLIAIKEIIKKYISSLPL